MNSGQANVGPRNEGVLLYMQFISPGRLPLVALALIFALPGTAQTNSTWTLFQPNLTGSADQNHEIEQLRSYAAYRLDVKAFNGSLEATDQGYSCEDESGSDCVAIGIRNRGSRERHLRPLDPTHRPVDERHGRPGKR